MPHVGLLSEIELAERAGTSPDRIGTLVAHGILHPSDGEGGGFRDVDVNRIWLAEALDRSGIPLEDIGRALASGIISLDFLADLWPDPAGFIPGKTMEEVARESGLTWDVVERSRVRLGLPQPSPGDPVRGDELELFLLAGVMFQAGLDEASLTRFSRVLGENLRRLAEAQVHLIATTILDRFLASGMPAQDAWDASARMSPQVTPMFERVLMLLYRRQQEHAQLQQIIEHFEDSMERAGLGRTRTATPPAIAFLDLSGFTRLTEEQGDEAAAGLASSLAELVQEATQLRGGKPVKLLGDGVMFHFADPVAAVTCSLDMVERAPAAGLPPAHAGVDAGPVVFQDGDYFGRTVNVAARVASKAGPGQVLVTEAVVEAAGRAGLAFREAGSFELKGVARPLVLHEASLSDSPGSVL
jgi:class 3 adenylate cyclase